MRTPNSASQKNSNEPKDKAAFARTGATKASASMPIMLPRKEPEVATPIARPAWPMRASG